MSFIALQQKTELQLESLNEPQSASANARSGAAAAATVGQPPDHNRKETGGKGDQRADVGAGVTEPDPFPGGVSAEPSRKTVTKPTGTEMGQREGDASGSSEVAEGATSECGAGGSGESGGKGPATTEEEGATDGVDQPTVSPGFEVFGVATLDSEGLFFASPDGEYAPKCPLTPQISSSNRP